MNDYNEFEFFFHCHFKYISIAYNQQRHWTVPEWYRNFIWTFGSFCLPPSYQFDRHSLFHLFYTFHFIWNIIIVYWYNFNMLHLIKSLLLLIGNEIQCILVNNEIHTHWSYTRKIPFSTLNNNLLRFSDNWNKSPLLDAIDTFFAVWTSSICRKKKKQIKNKHKNPTIFHLKWSNLENVFKI